MNNESKSTQIYSLSQFYTDNIPKFATLVLITKIHKHAMDLYGQIYPQNIDAKKDDKLLVAIFSRIMGNLHSSIKCDITYDECYNKLIKEKTTSLQTNSLHGNFSVIVEHFIGRTKTLNCPHYQKALKELQKMGYLKDKY